VVDSLHRVGIKSSLDKTYEALATREGLAAWWTRWSSCTTSAAPDPNDVKIVNWN